MSIPFLNEPETKEIFTILINIGEQELVHILQEDKDIPSEYIQLSIFITEIIMYKKWCRENNKYPDILA